MEEQEQKIKRETESMDYIIKGKIKKEDLGELPDVLPVMAYAARDRRVLGFAPVKEDGSFGIKYKYRVSGKEKKPIGVYLIIGPKLPGDQILKTKLEREFLSSKGFKRASPRYMYEITEEISISETNKRTYERTSMGFCTGFTYKGCIMTCSPLIEDACPTGCGDPGTLSTSAHRVYVRISREGKIIGDDILVSDGSESEESLSGVFSAMEIIPGLWIFPSGRTALVEVYQKIGGITNTLYSGNHRFGNRFVPNLLEFICIDRDEVEIIEIPELDGPGVGNSFGFSLVGHIPIDYIDQSTGYADSSGATASGTHKVKDFAFFGELQLYANIGEDLQVDESTGDCKIQYIRVKYEHLVEDDTGGYITDDEGCYITDAEGYIQTPFGNAREPREGEGDYDITETMGPLPLSETGGMIGVYRYANPYETTLLYPGKVINDWVLKGLLMVIYPSSLPFNYGGYRLTVEAYDTDMVEVSIADVDDNDFVEEFNLRIDNDRSALTGDIKDIMGTGDCGFLRRMGDIYPTFDITVEFDINNSHGNLRDFQLTAHWGANCKQILKAGEYQTYPGITPPKWEGESGISTTENKAWVECAYQFRLSARRRVTNGFSEESEREVFSKHITILSINPYEPCP